ncbi:MAG: hypothetical protein ABI609_12540 [Acidobacteriota bacterium]
MAWYRLNLPLKSAELDEKLDEYRDLVESAIARVGGGEMTARVYCDRRAAEAHVFLELEGRQPSWLTLRMMRLSSVEPPRGRAHLELLSEIANGIAKAPPEAAGAVRSI